MPPAARLTDMHTCPMVTGVVPHVGGPISAPGCPTVIIGGMPAARIGDMATCVGPPDTIIKGSPTVLIGGMPAARMGDTTAHGGVIVLGHMTTMIGDSGSGGGGGAGGGAAGGGGSPASTETATATEPATEEAAESAGEGGSNPSTVAAGAGTHWIDIVLVDEADQPVSGERFSVTLPDGREVSGHTSSEGRGRVEGIEQPGNCTLRFPNLDQAAWERIS